MVINNRLYNLLLKGWFRTKGRSGRQEYILRFLTMVFLAIISNFLIKLDRQLTPTTSNIVIMLLIGLVGLFSLLLSIAQVFFVTHRRLHDLNASGWWQLITFIPCGQIMMIGFIFFRGTKGPNRFGPEPE